MREVSVKGGAGMQRREYGLEHRPPSPWHGVDRNARTVVSDAHPSVVPNIDVKLGRVPSEVLVDNVANDLPQQVVQSAAVGTADVHARSAAYSLESLEDLDIVRPVFRSHARTLPPCVR